MPFPVFHPGQHLSEWPDCRLDILCPSCPGRHSWQPLRLIIEQRGDVTFADLLPRLICGQCGTRAAPVYLVAGLHREFCGGEPPAWSLELVPYRPC